MSLPVKLLETLKVVLGVSMAVAAIWGFVIPFDPDKLISLIDIIIGIIGTIFGTLVAGPALIRQTVGRITGHYVARADGKKVA